MIRQKVVIIVMIDNLPHSLRAFPNVMSCSPEPPCVVCNVGVVDVSVVMTVWWGIGEEREVAQVPGSFRPFSGSWITTVSMTDVVRAKDIGAQPVTQPSCSPATLVLCLVVWPSEVVGRNQTSGRG